MPHFDVRALLLVLVVSLSFGSTGSFAAGSELETAQDYWQAGQLKAAELTLKSMLQSDPDDADGRLLLGRVYLDLGQPMAAEQEFGRAKALGASAPDLLVLTARALLQQRQFTRALDAAQVPDTADDEVRADLLAVQAQAQAGMDHLKDAQILLSQALQLSPDLASAQIEQAKLSFRLGDANRAQALLEEAAAVNADDAAVAEAQADLAMAQRRFADANTLLTSALETARNRWMLYYKRAIARVELGLLATAQDDIEAAQRAHSNFTGLAFVRAKLAFAGGNNAEALAAAEAFLKLNPAEPAANLIAAQAARELGKLEQAREYVAAHLRALPNSRSGRLTQVMILAEAGDLAQAEELLSQFSAS